MRRGVLAVILAAVLVPVWILPVSAEGELGSIRVTVEPEREGTMLMLSYVGIEYGEGLQLMPEFGGGFVTGEDMRTRELWAWLAEQARDGLEKQITSEGTAMFTGLPKGVYLLTEKTPGDGSLEPVLISLPEADGSWMAEVIPGQYVIPKTGQPITPVLWAMGMVVSAFGIGILYESWHKSRKK